MLNAREPKIVNGPEILSKFVGASEENIRKLFAEAEKEVGVFFGLLARLLYSCLSPIVQGEERREWSAYHYL